MITREQIKNIAEKHRCASAPDKVPGPNGDLTLPDIKKAAREFGHIVVPDYMIVTPPKTELDTWGEAIERALKK